jgi:hypothetical protein
MSKQHLDYPFPLVGFCPMGCGQTLFVGSGGHITCSYIPCPRPTAVDEILMNQPVHHIVRTDEFFYEIQHPLAERLDEHLFDCELTKFLNGLAGSPQPPGFYRVNGAGTDWFWEFLKPY